MASASTGAMRISTAPDAFFLGEEVGDLVIFAASNTQRVLIGNQSASNAMLQLTSNSANVGGSVNAPDMSANIMQTTDIYLTTYDPRNSNTLSVIAPRYEADTFTTALAVYASNTAAFACNAAITSGAGAFGSNVAVGASNVAAFGSNAGAFASNAAASVSNWGQLNGGSNLALAFPATLQGTTTVKGDVVPDADSVYDLGTDARRFRSLYVSGNTIYVGSTAMKTDAGTGVLSFSNMSPTNSNPIRLVIDEVQVGSAAEGGTSVILRPDSNTGGLKFVPATVIAGDVVESTGDTTSFDSNLPLQAAFASNAAAGALSRSAGGTVSGAVALSNGLGVSGDALVSGMVGVGTATPGAPLHVTGSNATGVSILAQFDVVASSDIRLKADLQPIDGALDRISDITGYTFTRARDAAAAADTPATLTAPPAPSPPRFAGLVAQEVQRVLPEVVHTSPSGMLSVAYGNMAALLVQGIKELRATVQALSQRVATLEVAVGAPESTI